MAGITLGLGRSTVDMMGNTLGVNIFFALTVGSFTTLINEMATQAIGILFDYFAERGIVVKPCITRRCSIGGFFR